MTININNAISAIKEKLDVNSKTPFIIAVDGRCGAGKTTFADLLRRELDCNIIHADHFFLQRQQRTERRLAEAGSNIDYERLVEEVLKPLAAGLPFSYQIFDCKTMSLAEKICINPKRAAVVEGSYSCHPSMWNYYDLKIFMDIDKESQKNRIIRRNGKEQAEMFFNKWIPMEEKYFKAYDILNRCDIVIDAK